MDISNASAHRGRKTHTYALLITIARHRKVF